MNWKDLALEQWGNDSICNIMSPYDWGLLVVSKRKLLQGGSLLKSPESRPQEHGHSKCPQNQSQRN